MIVAVGLFDLTLTVLAHESGRLVEWNPIVALVLAHWGAGGLAAYRLSTLVIGFMLLAWGLRMYRLGRYPAESEHRVRIVVWGGQLVLVGTHTALVAWWLVWLAL